MSNSATSKNAVFFVVITVALDAIGYGIVIPVLPELIVEMTGKTLSDAAKVVGYMWFAYAFTLFFFAPIIGGLSDKFGRRPVLLCALIAFGIDYLIMASASTILLFFIGRAIAGVTGASYSTANAYVADISTPENRSQNFGMLGAAFGTGFILGPVIGGLLGDIDLRAPFYAAAAISFINALYGWFVLKESLAKEKRRAFNWRRANPVGSLVHLKTNPTVFGLAIAFFLYMIGHFSLPTVWSVYTLEKFDWSVSQVGFSLGVAGVCMIIVQAGLIRAVVPKIGAPKAAFIGLGVMAIGFVGYASAMNDVQIYFWLIFASLAGFVNPAMQSMLTSQVPADAQGELQGAVASLNSIAVVIAPLIMTGLFSHFTSESAPIYFPGAAFLAAAVLTGCALFLVIAVVAKSEKLRFQNP